MVEKAAKGQPDVRQSRKSLQINLRLVAWSIFIHVSIDEVSSHYFADYILQHDPR